VCTAFNKPGNRVADLPLDYIGFDLPDAFVIGYGLDYRQKYRNLPRLAVLKTHTDADRTEGASSSLAN
jgi:hypoxanthine-guanine phosphoribosyltransferase